MQKRTTLTALAAVSTLAVAALAATTSAQATVSNKAVANTVPHWTANAHRIAAAASSAPISVRVYLAPQGGLAQLQRTALAMSTPGNAQYHHFLTSKQYVARFAPTAASVAAVRSWLAASGLHVAGVAAQNRYLEVRGTVAGAERAFSTQLATYRTAGVTATAPESAVRVPSALASAVLTVTGLDTKPRLITPTHVVSDAPPAGGFRNARPCSTFFGQLRAKYQGDFSTKLPKFSGRYLPYAPCGYTGPQFRSAYEGNTTLTGKGVTVGVLDAYASPTIGSDTATYARRHGDGAYAAGQYRQVKVGVFRRQAVCDPSGWYGEQTLDIEAVHAMAPKANVRFYGAASCEDDDFLSALGTIVKQDKVQIVSNSWGDAGEVSDSSTLAAYTAVFAQGATEGISFLFSSGDSGDELANTGLKQADDPATNPFVTAVGGTSTAIGAAGGIRFETGWGTKKFSLSDSNTWTPLGFLYGAGGGASATWNKPKYQDGVVGGAYRRIPDVAMDADPQTGMLIGITQTFPGGVHYDEYRIGGTSLASPLFAGMTALALQRGGGTGAGLLNPVIYKNAKNKVFTDVRRAPAGTAVVRADYANGLSGAVLYSVRTFGQDSTLHAGKGWDDVTGVGTPGKRWLKVFGSS